jgi:hypothetical protein
MFGKYKQSITDILVRSYATNKKLFKESFHSLMGGLRENKVAREFFVLYGEIENKKFDDKELAEEYLNTVIKALKNKKKNLRIPIIKEQEEAKPDFLDLDGDGDKKEPMKKAAKDKKKSKSWDKGMRKIVKGIDLKTLSPEEREEYMQALQAENKIYAQLDSLVFNESVRSIEKNLIHKRNLVTHLTRKDKSIKITESIPTSILTTLAVNKFNKKYKSLTQQESTHLKEYLEIDNEKLKEEFMISKTEVLNKLNSLKESNEDKEVVNKLNEVITQMDSEKLNKFSLYKINKLKKELN